MVLSMARVPERVMSVAVPDRGERGCEWDREQTFASIARYTIEEAYEVADAIVRHGRHWQWRAVEAFAKCRYR